MTNKDSISYFSNFTTQSRQIKVAIANAYPLFTSGISSIISTTPDLVLSSTFLNGQFLVDWFNGSNADIILLDMNMPILDCEQTSKWLLTRFPKVKIIILAAENNKSLMHKMYDDGIFGYLTKDIKPADLVAAILKVYNGEKVLPENWFVNKNPINNHKDVILTKRELGILDLIAKGKANKEIAGLLNLSPLTVKKHREHIMHKMNSHNTAQLIEGARVIGLI